MPDPQPFQTVQTKTETVYTFVPAEFAKEMYALGSLYQAVSISLNEALKLAQEVADKVSYDIGIEEPFVAVQFLRDELEESLSDTEEDGSAKTAATSPDSNP